MSIPKQPRQKMINLMYLVLTALLALNVSAEILNAFKTIGTSIEKSNQSIEEKNSVIITQIKRKLKDKPSIKPVADKALKLQEISQVAYDYIDQIKLEILRRANYNPVTGTYDISNLDIPTKYLLTEKKGLELYQVLKNFKIESLLVVDPEDTVDIKLKYALDLTFERSKVVTNVAKESWEYKYFSMTPVVASLAILSKFQSDVRNTEAMILEYLFTKIGDDVIVYDELEPFVSASSNYILLGDKYEATIGVGAISSTVKPVIKVNGNTIPVSRGVGRYIAKPTVVGDRKLDIEITLKKADGSFETTRKVVRYVVGSSAGVTVTADGMNLFYIGIENPVTIIGQVGDEKLNISISQGTIRRKRAGKYGVNVITPGDCFVSVSEKGKREKAIKFPFRVKTIPDPSLKVGGLKPGTVKVSDFRSQTGVLAVLEDFEFDAYFTVNSFKLLLSGSGFPDIYQGEVKGAVFTPSIERALRKLRKGTIVTLIDVYVTGPDKKSRRLSSVSYMMK